MSYDPPRPAGRLLLTPEDKDAPARVSRLRRLGLGEHTEPAFDAFADRLAEVAAVPYSMVNFIDENRQFFAGLHTPDGNVAVTRPLPAAPDGTAKVVGRYMTRDYGFCPHVVVRRRALVLEDVCDYPRFAGNPVVDEIGVRSYLGPRSSTARASPSARSASSTSNRARGEGRPGDHQVDGGGTGRADRAQGGHRGSDARGRRREGKLRPRLRNPRWTNGAPVRQISPGNHPSPRYGRLRRALLRDLTTGATP